MVAGRLRANRKEHNARPNLCFGISRIGARTNGIFMALAGAFLSVLSGVFLALLAKLGHFFSVASNGIFSNCFLHVAHTSKRLRRPHLLQM